MKIKLSIIALFLTICARMAAESPSYPQPILHPDYKVFGYAYDRDKNKLSINYIFQEANEFIKDIGLAIVKINGHYGVIDTGAIFQIDPIYDDVIYNPEHSNFTVKLHGKYGVLAPGNRVIIPVKFDNIGEVDNHFYEGELDGEWVYVNNNGKYTSDMSEYMRWRKAVGKGE